MTAGADDARAREAHAAVATIRRTLREADRLDGGNDPSIWQNADDAALYLLGCIVELDRERGALAACVEELEAALRRIEADADQWCEGQCREAARAALRAAEEVE